MKKVLVLAISLSFVFSCKKDNSSDELLTSKDSVEENKDQLKSEAVALMSSIEEMDNCSVTNEALDVFNCASPSAKTGNSKMSEKLFFKTISNIKSYNETKNLKVFNTLQIKAVKENGESLKEQFDNQVGVWKWNSNSDEFLQTSSSGNSIKYVVDCNNENLTFEISEFKSIQHSTEGELPTSLKATMKVNGESVMSQDFSMPLTANDNLPSSLVNKTSMGCMSISTENSSSSSSASTKFDVSINDSSILSQESKFNGDLEVLNGDELETNPLKSFSQTLSFSNIKLKTTLNVEGKELPSDEDSIIDFLNSNSEIQLVIENEIIAEGEFYNDIVTRREYYYDYYSGDYVYYDVEETELNVRLRFPDDTTQDLDTYFETGFESLETDLEDLFDTFQDKLEDISI